MAADRAAEQRTAAEAKQAGRRALRRHESVRGPLLESDLLTKAFRVFDFDGKGYITVSDLQRVLGGFGQEGVGGEWMAGATGGDREGRRITYGSFVRMMSHTVKRALDEGEYIFQQGEPVTHFYCLLSGEAAVVRRAGFFSEEQLNTLRAGEYFGENSLLEGNATRSVSVRCATPVEVLTLSKADFEAAFRPTALKRSGSGGADARAEEERRATLISFIRLVSPQQRRTLRDGEDVFRAGDAADKFHILAKGKLAVVGEGGGRTFGEIAPGEGFGEASLLGGKSSHSKTVRCAAAGGCEVVEILGSTFLRLVEKSQAVRRSFERLDERRTKQNQQAAPR